MLVAVVRGRGKGEVLLRTSLLERAYDGSMMAAGWWGTSKPMVLMADRRMALVA